MEDCPDDQLLARTPHEPAAFDLFYRRYERAVLSYFMRRTGNPELAADLAAETFAAALIGAKRYRPGPAPATSWLFGIAHHRLLRSLQRGRVEERARRKLGIASLSVDDDMLERVERLGAQERAEALLAELSDEQAAAIRAHVIEERPHAEVASLMNCSETVVRKRVSRGLAKLRDKRDRS